MGMYVSWRLPINVRHSISSGYGGVVLYSFCYPIRAMFLLKSLPKICTMGFGNIVIYCIMFFSIIDIHHMSSSCDGMYKCSNIINHGCSDSLLIFVICRFGENYAQVRILMMFLGYVYCHFRNVTNPFLASVYCILYCKHLVNVCV